MIAGTPEMGVICQELEMLKAELEGVKATNDQMWAKVKRLEEQRDAALAGVLTQLGAMRERCALAAQAARMWDAPLEVANAIRALPIEEP